MSATVRLVTINLWGVEPPLTRRLDLAASQLRQLRVDLVVVQEVRPLQGIGAGPTTADALADALGLERTYQAAVAWPAGTLGRDDPGGEEGLAILSRFPIVTTQVTPLPEPRPTEARILLSACVKSAAGPLWCHTTHLHHRLADGVAREKQVVVIDEVVAGIASDLPQLLGGDFNATPAHDEIRFLRGETTLMGRRTHYQDAYARVHPDRPGFTWSAENAQALAARSLDIDRRIDYIFVTSRSKDGRGTVCAADVVLTERQAGVSASDHYGVLAEVQLAPS